MRKEYDFPRFTKLMERTWERIYKETGKRTIHDYSVYLSGRRAQIEEERNKLENYLKEHPEKVEKGLHIVPKYEDGEVNYVLES